MKVVLKLEGLDCANCAAKIETAVSKIQGINDVNVVFMTQKLSFTTEREDVDAIVEQITKVAMKASSDVKSVKRIK
ncbi:MAG: cation transporter [Candidatus Methanomethylophilaceae archaeon]|nr:cation transporter [Candidatus Methanomethylophilaceae archaeon]